MRRVKGLAVLVGAMAMALPGCVASPRPGLTKRTASPSTSRPREELAYCKEDDAPKAGDDRARLWLWSPATGQKRQLARDYDAYSLCFSPDGQRLAFLGAPAGKKVELWLGLDLFVLDMQTGKVRRITEGLSGDVGCQIAWRPGTNQVAVGCIAPVSAHLETLGDGGLWLVDVDTGKKRQLIAPGYRMDVDKPVNTDPRFNRDGSRLACTRSGCYGAAFALDSPERWFRLDKPRLMGQVWLMDWSWAPGGKLILAATAAERCPNGPGSAKRGPGGLWEWQPTGAATTRPIISVPDPHGAPKRTTGPSAAKPLLDPGVSVYAVAVSHDGRQVAYVDRRGVHVANLRTHAVRDVLSPSQLPGLSSWVKYDAGDNLVVPLPYCRLQWSPSDSYLGVCSRYHWLGVIAVRGAPAVLGSVHVKEWKDLMAAWRPTGAQRP